MTYTIESVRIPVKTGNNWIDSLLYDTKTANPGLYLQALTIGHIARNHVTYTFDSLPINSLAKQRLEEDLNGDAEFFDGTQRANALKAIEHIHEITGIEFIEVSSSDADLYFLKGDFADPEWAGGHRRTVEWITNPETGK